MDMGEGSTGTFQRKKELLSFELLQIGRNTELVNTAGQVEITAAIIDAKTIDFKPNTKRKASQASQSTYT